MYHAGTTEIQTARLILRKFSLDDAASMFRNWASDPAVTQYLRWPAHSSPETTRRVLRDWVDAYQDPSFYQWAIVPRDLNEPIGSISVVEQNERLGMVHIGFCIGRRWWHRGITSEALAAVIPYLFETVRANRIESQHDPNNPNSGRVMKACGFTFEGTLRQADFSNQGIVDACRYSLLASEYNSAK